MSRLPLSRLLSALGVWLAAAWLLAAPALAQSGPTFPPLTGRVVDAAHVLPADTVQRLDGKLAALEKQSGRQFVVATLPDLQGYEISDYGYQLGRAWGIGSKDKNDGAILIVAPKERKVRIEVGYGLEPVLTDGLSSLIIAQKIVPKFKAGDLAGGIEDGADAVIAQLQLPAAEAQARAAAAQKQANDAAKQGQGGGFGPAIFVLFFIFFVVLPMLRAMFGGWRGRRYGGGSGLGPILMWSALDAMSRRGDGGGGGFGGFGGGDSGGGGFSGGGGSFGGGGSSGSW